MAKEVAKFIRLELDDQQRTNLGEVMEVTGMRSAKPALWYAVSTTSFSATNALSRRARPATSWSAT